MKRSKAKVITVTGKMEVPTEPIRIPVRAMTPVEAEAAHAASLQLGPPVSKEAIAEAVEMLEQPVVLTEEERRQLDWKQQSENTMLVHQAWAEQRSKRKLPPGL